MKDFFLSYNQADRDWAEWIAWQLEEAGYSTVIQAWDFAAGGNFVLEMDRAAKEARGTVAVLSENYFSALYTQPEWAAAFAQDPTGAQRQLIPVRVRECTPAGLLAAITYIDLVGLEPAGAKTQLLAGIQEKRLKPAREPPFPGGAAGQGAAPPAFPASPLPPIDLSHLPAGAPHFLGRQAELAALDQAWAETGRTPIVQLIAPGGTGKTSLMTRWVDRLRAENWRGAKRVFAWSFYSQGSGEDRRASEDGFLDAAIRFFGVTVEAAASPWDKGEQLATTVAAYRSLLILDGLEPLQYPPGHALAGELKAPGVQTLLKRLAARGQRGLVLITSREHLADLADRARDAERPDAGVLLLDLDNLVDSDGARLLYRLGVRRAGAAAIAEHAAATDAELQAASREVEGHALTLALLGSYLARAWGGDARKRDMVDFARANERTHRGHAFRAIAAYETWFTREGAAGERALAALRLVGFFDRPASRANLAALRQPPAIAGLTEALVGLDEPDWHGTLADLAHAGLLRFDAGSGSVDAHPLLREYFAQRLRHDLPAAWREGHRRLYEQIKTDTPYRPDGLAGLQPLYQAVAHGCQAGLVQEACDEVYRERILRGTGLDGFYSAKKLGAFGADLGALACFFDPPWRRPVPQLEEANQAWLLNEAAIRLRALGRLAEALEPVRAGAKMRVRQNVWNNAAASYNNLSELQLSLGQIDAAVQEAALAVEYADRSGDTFLRMVMRTALANARQQQGESELARQGFAEAEGMQAEWQPEYPLLYSLRGFQYGERLLAAAERAAWRGAGDAATLAACAGVAQRATQTLEWIKGKLGLLDEALDHLTLARCALYADLLQDQPPGADARGECEAAVSGLRAAGTQHELPRGLLTRAWLRHACGDADGARADLAEVETLASRGGMKLFLADLALTRARLFRDRAQLQLARELIDECGYGRRRPELQDAEQQAERDDG
ncbi:toll/interleukin-1 receptor domain-containing protein [Accumulibacter sp.]|uniref:toll/interleukin-1 receptor domain-containing protein n=1 Tax=Accumulibacter sp. TaxID=2053492 RepID=UPI00260197CE|nr:toll/interleukin-1 receptor domain-containing protein [Accumulibacter sp.]